MRQYSPAKKLNSITYQYVRVNRVVKISTFSATIAQALVRRHFAEVSIMYL
jgi:hypothetical protein